MALNVWRVSLGLLHNAEICNYKGVHSGALCLAKKIRQSFKLVLTRKRIAGEVDCRTLFVRLCAGYGKLFHGKVACRGSHSKAFTGKVNGIRAVVERHFKALHISGRRKKFGFSVNHNSALRQRH